MRFCGKFHARKLAKFAERAASAIFFALGLTYAQSLQMNEKVQSNNPSYTAAMDSVLTRSFSSFSVDNSRVDSVFARLRAGGYTTVKTSYTGVVEYGTASDAFSGQSYAYTSDPFDCTIYRIIKDGEVVGWIVDKETKHYLMNEFGQPDPFKFYVERLFLLFFAETEKGKQLKKILEF